MSEATLVDLPRSLKDLEDFSNDILDSNGLPNLPSYHQAIATMIMHLPPTQATADKKYFVDCVKKAMANQIAYEVIQRIKEDELKKAEEAKLKVVENVAPTTDAPTEKVPDETI